MEKATKEINGFKDYLCNESGMIYSVRSQKFLKQAKDSNGYMTIELYGKTQKVHVLIANTFISNPENKPQVNHKDGDKTNNDIKNLEWVTAKENVRHAFKMKLRQGNKGESHPLRKLCNTDIIIIKEAWKKFGYGSQSKMAKYYGVKFSIISAICRNKKWSHV